MTRVFTKIFSHKMLFTQQTYPLTYGSGITMEGEVDVNISQKLLTSPFFELREMFFAL